MNKRFLLSWCTIFILFLLFTFCLSAQEAEVTNEQTNQDTLETMADIDDENVIDLGEIDKVEREIRKPRISAFMKRKKTRDTAGKKK